MKFSEYRDDAYYRDGLGQALQFDWCAPGISVSVRRTRIELGGFPAAQVEELVAQDEVQLAANDVDPFVSGVYALFDAPGWSGRPAESV